MPFFLYPLWICFLLSLSLPLAIGHSWWKYRERVPRDSQDKILIWLLEMVVQDLSPASEILPSVFVHMTVFNKAALRWTRPLTISSFYTSLLRNENVDALSNVSTGLHEQLLLVIGIMFAYQVLLLKRTQGRLLWTEVVSAVLEKKKENPQTTTLTFLDSFKDIGNFV